MEADNKDKIIIFTSSRPATQFMEETRLENRGPAHVNIEDLQTNINIFLVKMDEIIKKSPEKIGRFNLDTIEIHAEVNGEGQVGLLGTGVTVGGTAGITFVLSKSKG